MNCLLVLLPISLFSFGDFEAFGAEKSRAVLFNTDLLDGQSAAYEKFEISKNQATDLSNRQNGASWGFQEEECGDFYSWEYPWERDFGDERFGAKLEMKSHLKYDCSQVEAGALAQANGTIFEEDLSLAKADIQAWANDKEMVLASSLYVLGFEVHQSRIEKMGSLSISGFPHHPIQETGTYSTMIGPVPVVVNYGVVGKVGMKWKARLSPFSAEVFAKPLVDVESYVRGGLAVKEVLELKIGGRLNVLDSSYKMHSGIATISVENKPSLEAESSIKGNLAILDGDFSGKVVLLNQEVFSKEFFRWDGYELNGVLTEHKERILLSDTIASRWGKKKDL